MRFRYILPAAAVLAAAVLPGPANAAIVGVDVTNRTLHIIDNGPQNNDVGVSFTGGRIRISDNAPIGAIFSNDECENETANSMICPLGNVSLIRANLGFGSDVYTSAVDIPTVVSGGAGSDTYRGGIATRASSVNFSGGDSFDRAFYGSANAGVTVSKDERANDGRSGLDRDNIGADVEHLVGSRFADTLVGGDSPTEHYEGFGGDDTLIGGAGSDVFLMAAVADGADRIFGGGDRDSVSYAERTQPVNVNLSAGGNDDGEAGERDEIREIESARGGAAGDTLRVHPDGTVPVSLLGFGGNDTITGARGGDTLNGGAGRDTMTGDAGNDIIQARDGESDTVGCGADVDTADVESGLDVVAGCETVQQVGVLRLAPKALATKAGKPVAVRLSWRHPTAWRKLRAIELRLSSRGEQVGTVAIAPRSGKVDVDGAVQLARRARVARDGKTVTARLAVRLDRSLAGEEVRLEVEATDARGRRQVESGAGTIRVAG